MRSIVIALFCFGVFSAGAQDTIRMQSDRPISLTYYPLMHASQALKIGVDLPIKNHSRIEITPMLYAGYDYYQDYSPPEGIELEKEVSFDGKVMGFGLESMFRYSPRDWMFDDPVVYVGAGAGIHSMRFDYREFGYYTDSQGGLDYLKHGLLETSDQLLRTDVFAVVGLRSRGETLLGVDFNMGVAYKHTTIENLDGYTPRDDYRGDIPSHAGNGFYFRFQAAFTVNIPKRDKLFKHL